MMVYAFSTSIGGQRQTGLCELKDSLFYTVNSR